MSKFKKQACVEIAFNENEEIKIDVTIVFTRKDDAVSESQKESVKNLKKKLEQFILDQF